MARSLFQHVTDSRIFSKTEAARTRYLRAPDRLVSKLIVGWFPVFPGARWRKDFARCRLHVNRVAPLTEQGVAGPQTMVYGVNLDDDQPLATYLTQICDWRVKEVRNAFKD